MHGPHVPLLCTFGECNILSEEIGAFNTWNYLFMHGPHVPLLCILGEYIIFRRRKPSVFAQDPELAKFGPKFVTFSTLKKLHYVCVCPGIYGELVKNSLLFISKSHQKSCVPLVQPYVQLKRKQGTRSSASRAQRQFSRL